MSGEVPRILRNEDEPWAIVLWDRCDTLGEVEVGPHAIVEVACSRARGHVGFHRMTTDDPEILAAASGSETIQTLTYEWGDRRIPRRRLGDRSYPVLAASRLAEIRGGVLCNPENR